MAKSHIYNVTQPLLIILLGSVNASVFPRRIHNNQVIFDLSLIFRFGIITKYGIKACPVAKSQTAAVKLNIVQYQKERAVSEIIKNQWYKPGDEEIRSKKIHDPFFVGSILNNIVK